MLRRASHPTAYPGVNEVLNELLRGVRAVLGDHFLGMYLYGSLALGDFDPASSDIDFVVVTDDELADESISALQSLHAHITQAYPRWGTALEGSYIPQHALRRYDEADARHPHVFEGSFRIEDHGVHWVIERYVLRERGMVLAGPPPHTLLDPIRPDELRRAVVELVRSWWAPMVDHPVRLEETKYRTYAVLTMCRVLYTLRYGTVVSKPAAARWAGETLAQRWRVLIERTLAGDADGNEDAINETREFIRHTHMRCKQYQTGKS